MDEIRHMYLQKFCRYSRTYCVGIENTSSFDVERCFPKSALTHCLSCETIGLLPKSSPMVEVKS